MNIVVSGGTGFLGRRIVAALAKDHDVRVLSRHSRDGAAAWQPEREPPPEAVVHEAEAIVHLAGEPVAQRWTPEAKQRIRESRRLGTANLVTGLASSRARVLVCASAIGIYGARGDEPLTEVSRPGIGFLPEVCAAWEHEAEAAERLGIRVVRLRFGIVLSPEGGALARMLPPFRAWVGGRLGSGKQWMSWIHVDDVVELVRFALEGSLNGAVNATAPGAVRNSEFTRALANGLHRPALFPVPAAALRLLFGEMAEVLLASQRVLPQAAQSAGFRFGYPRLEEALANLL